MVGRVELLARRQQIADEVGDRVAGRALVVAHVRDPGRVTHRLAAARYGQHFGAVVARLALDVAFADREAVATRDDVALLGGARGLAQARNERQEEERSGYLRRAHFHLKRLGRGHGFVSAAGKDCRALVSIVSNK